jgi:WD40 repeat protein
LADVTCLAFSKDGEQLLCGRGTGGIVWLNADSGAIIREIRAHSSVVTDLALSPDGFVLASTGADHALRLYSPFTGDEKTDQVMRHDQAIRQVQFAPDSTMLATAGDDGMIRIWDARDSTLRIKLHEPNVSAIAFSEDGRRLFSIAGSRVRIWSTELQDNVSRDLDGARMLLELAELPSPARRLNRRFVGAHLVVADAEHVRVWSTEELSSAKDLRSPK